MTRAFRTSVILWLLCVGAPSPASASIMDWLDRLSGPGPFWGVDLDMQVNCPSRKEGSPPSGVKALASAIVISCPNESFHTQHFNWYLTTGLGFATSGKNKLNYGEASNTSTKAIGTFKVGTAVDYTASRAFDLGVGAAVSVEVALAPCPHEVRLSLRYEGGALFDLRSHDGFCLVAW